MLWSIYRALRLDISTRCSLPWKSESLTCLSLPCLDYNISPQITTPLSAQDLSSALISALEFNTRQPQFLRPTTWSSTSDNLVNEKLIIKILEKYGRLQRTEVWHSFFFVSLSSCCPWYTYAQMDIELSFIPWRPRSLWVQPYDMHRGLPPRPSLQ
jgi:osomolarity two-component system sensor histidine kinase NIK1